MYLHTISHNIYNINSAVSEIKSDINEDAVRIIKQLYNDDILLYQHSKTIKERLEPDIISVLAVPI
ncbi:MAG: hypothetical protein K2N11_07215 [Mucispirillum sp.]|nr:hypothetical protein [Mucispirillum sp.]